MVKIPRLEAATLGAKTFFTGKPCKYGHTSERYTSSGCCVECALKNARESDWRSKNKDRSRKADRAWRAKYTEGREAELVRLKQSVNALRAALIAGYDTGMNFDEWDKLAKEALSLNPEQEIK